MQIIPGVHLLGSAGSSHVYLINGPEPLLISTGLPGGARRILRELRSLGLPENGLSRILLTHHDMDHTGNAVNLARATGAELWISQPDAVFLKRKQNRPGIKHLIETVMPAKRSETIHTYPQECSFGKRRVLPAPGHTPGHVIFQYGSVVFTGDLFQNKRGCLSPMPRVFHWDASRQAESLRSLAGLTFSWICPAHGRPFQNGPAFQEFLKMNQEQGERT